MCLVMFMLSHRQQKKITCEKKKRKMKIERKIIHDRSTYRHTNNVSNAHMRSRSKLSSSPQFESFARNSSEIWFDFVVSFAPARNTSASCMQWLFVCGILFSFIHSVSSKCGSVKHAEDKWMMFICEALTKRDQLHATRTNRCCWQCIRDAYTPHVPREILRKMQAPLGPRTPSNKHWTGIIYLYI